MKKLHFAWVILLAVSLIRGFAGPAVNGSAGLFLAPVSGELGVGIGQLSIYLSVSSVVSMIWLPVAGNLFEKYNVKIMVIIGIVLQTAAFIALGFMKSVWGWYIMAVPFAMGAVILVNLLGPVLINRWFVSNKGLVMGIMMTITSLLGAVFQPLLTSLIGGEGWRFTYVVFGAAAFICMLMIALLFLKNKPQDKGIFPYNAAKADDQIKSDKNSLSGISVKVAVKSIAFYMLLLFMIVLTGFASFSQHITTYGLEQGFSITVIGMALSVSMVGAAIGSLLIGFASDKWGIIPTGIGVMGMGFLSICLFLFGGQVLQLFIVATFFHGLATSSIGVVAPMLTSYFFGNKNYEKLYSLVMIGSPLSSIILLPAYGFIYDTLGSYWPVFVFLLVALVIGGMSLWIGQASSRKLQQ